MDPLSPSNINAGWSSSPPETPTSLFNPSTSRPAPTPTSEPNGSFREPKVFGAPTPGLIERPEERTQVADSPKGGRARNSGGEERAGQGGGARYLRVRISGLERNRKDLLIRFDASTNLPNFRTTLYKNMQRSYVEFQRFAEQAQATSPQTIIPALPLPTTSAITDEEDDRLVRIALQRWFTRICEDPVLQKDDELRLFIESDFGYNPAPPPSARRPISASTSATNVLTAALSKVVRRGPLDEDEELSGAKGALEKLEGNWGGAAAAVGALGKSRRAHALANQDIGSKLISLSTVESDFSLAAAERKLGRSIEQLSSMAAAQSASENVVLSDSLGYQAFNARAAKASLAQRTQILEDSQTATKLAINKRRNVERLKGSSSINTSRVDDAITEMDEANDLEETLSKRLNAISQNLHVALRQHSKNAHEDVALALLENARLSLGYHRHTLRELEALRPDFARIGTASSAVPAASVAQSQLLPPPLAYAPSNPNTPVRAPPPIQYSHQAQAGPSNPSQPSAPTMSSRNYASPPRAPAMETTKSMFLPPPSQQPIHRPNSADSNAYQARHDPLAPGPPAGLTNGGGGGMAQSMMLPGQAPGQYGRGQGYPGRGGTVGRSGARRLDERQAAKLLAGGF